MTDQANQSELVARFQAALWLVAGVGLMPIGIIAIISAKAIWHGCKFGLRRLESEYCCLFSGLPAAFMRELRYVLKGKKP